MAGSLPAALVEGLLGGFPPGDPARPPDLVLALEPARGPPPAGLPPLFWYGEVQAFADGDGLLLTDGRSTVRVAAGGGRIDVGAAEGAGAAGERHRFQHLLLFTALLRALSARGLFHLHAAGLVHEDGRTILVAGTAGSGKTTLALALLEAGLGYLGDDVVLLAERAGRPAVLSFPRPFHVAPATAAPYPALRPLLGERYAGGEKRDLDPRRAFPGRERAEGGAPALLLLPELANRPETVAEPASGAVALGALLESSAYLAADGEALLLARVALLARAVDGATALRVKLGRDALECPGEIARRLLAARTGGG